LRLTYTLLSLLSHHSMSLKEKKSESITENVVAVHDEKDDDFILLTTENRKAAERSLLRRLDTRLMPTVVIIYIMNYIDRVAITAARLQGLEADLGISDVQYASILAILYATYSPAQIPSNMILGYITRPSLYIGGCVIAWGLTSAMTGVTKNFGGIMVCRVFIGLPEAAFYPGCMYLLSRWYTRKELALRSAVFYVGLLISNAFGSLIAAGILSGMQGKLGIAAWRWLFYIEGAITMFLGLLTMWLLPDLPHNTRWLSPAERRLAQARLAEDAAEADQDASDATIFDGFKLAISDVKVWIFMLMGCSQLLGLSFINFFPTLTATLGYNTTITLVMSAPPWVFASILCVINAWHCDRTGERFFHMAFWWWAIIVGYIIALSTMSTGGRYFSLFLMATGYCGFALTLNWVSNAIPRPPAKRSVAMGMVNGVGNLGNMAGSYVWQASWGPKYHQSMIISICSLVLATILGLIMRYMLIRENKRMEQEEKALMEGPERERIEEAARLEGISFEEAIRRRKGFRYLY